MQEDGEVDEDLQGAADDELDRRLPQVEVGRLKDVSAGPHQNHADAVKVIKMSIYLNKSASAK